MNSVVRDVHDLETIPLRSGPNAPVGIKDVGYVQDSSDAPTGYALADGRRAVDNPAAKSHCLKEVQRFLLS